MNFEIERLNRTKIFALKSLIYFDNDLILTIFATNCASITAKQVDLSKVDLPPIFAPVTSIDYGNFTSFLTSKGK